MPGRVDEALSHQAAAQISSGEREDVKPEPGDLTHTYLPGATPLLREYSELAGFTQRLARRKLYLAATLALFDKARNIVKPM
jgi:hypothetical protein